MGCGVEAPYTGTGTGGKIGRNHVGPENTCMEKHVERAHGPRENRCGTHELNGTCNGKTTQEKNGKSPGGKKRKGYGEVYADGLVDVLAITNMP